MNHNAYFIKNNVDTAYRNLETYFTKCNVSVSEVKGFLEVGDAKNIIIEDYDDNVESHILLPSDGVIVYKDADFSIKLLIEGNTTYKVTEQMNDIINYFEKSPTIIKDNYRMHGNKVVLLGWQQNQSKLNNISASTSEYMLLNLKFKKVFSKDIPFIIVDENTLGQQFHCCVRIDCAQYFKHTGKEDTLKSKQRKELIKFLRSPSEDEPEKLNWKVVLVEWNRNNSTKKVPLDLEMPNYLELK